MLNITKRMHFDAAHRLINHECKCKNIHGHRYEIEATFSADVLDEIGRVIDFSVIKKELGGWLDDNWDHNIVLDIRDKEFGEQVEALTGQKVYYMPYNPTAENMAIYIYENICPKLFAKHNIKCTKIRLYETPTSYAEIGE